MLPRRQPLVYEVLETFFLNLVIWQSSSSPPHSLTDSLRHCTNYSRVGPDLEVSSGICSSLSPRSLLSHPVWAPEVPVPTYQWNGVGLFVTFACTSTLQTRAFSVVGPPAWNGLTLALRLLPRIDSDIFCCSLKTALFSRAIGSGALMSSKLEEALYKFTQ